MKGRSSGLLLGVAVVLIICGFLTVFNPGGFWSWINILLGIALIFSGISAIINSIKNKDTSYISFLFVIGILVFILGFVLIGSSEANFVGKLMVWLFALRALMRGGMLIFFGIQNKETMPLRWGISTLGIILVILAIATAISSATMANLVGICIGISIIFDGLSLLFFSLRGKNSAQAQIIISANQKEIAQYNSTDGNINNNDINQQK